MRIRIMTTLLLLGLAFPATHARAQATSARQHYDEGTKAFDLGLYDKAVAEYMAAYQLKSDPALLYNLAQAHRLGGHPRDALRFYRVYLQRQPDAPNRAEVEDKIRELKITVDKLDASQSRLPPDHTIDQPMTPDHTSEPPPAAVTSEPASVAVVTPPPPKSPPPPGRTFKVAGISTGAVGVAGVAVGIAFGVLAQQESDQLTSTSRMAGAYDPARYDAGKRDQIIEGVTLGIGLAAVAGGVTLYLLGRHQAQTAPRDVAWLR